MKVRAMKVHTMKMFAMIVCISSSFFSSSHAIPSFSTGQVEHFPGARVVLDVGSRIQPNATASQVDLFNFIGIDAYSDLQTSHRHWGSLVVQLYYFHMERLVDPRQNYSASALFPCVIAPDLILIPQGVLNLKIGHIWPEYGLRNDVNTTQTLRQLINVKNIGLQVDWGIDLHGEYNDWSYSFTLTRGKSEAWPSNWGTFENYLFAQRIAYNYSPIIIGMSNLSAQLDLNASTIKRWRTGIDLQYEAPISVLVEASIGEDQDLTTIHSNQIQNIMNTILELSWLSSLNTVMLYMQQRYFRVDETSTHPTTLGIRYMPINNLYVASEIEHQDFITHLTEGEQLLARLQLRYRW